jgi:zinc/manganese transport system ATP-binding protein
VPQNYTAALGEAIRCRDLVTLGLTGGRFGLRRTTPAERARVDEALERVGAAAYADRRMSELSGGQQQRVAIAQAIVDDAELLLLDEPLANLDLRNQQEIVRLLGQLHRERDVTIMVVAHDLNPLLPVLTDAVYLLDAHPHHDAIGEVVQEELLTHLYGTPVGVVRTAQGDLFTRAAWRDPLR